MGSGKAVCYVRVSTEEQAKGGVSLEAQEKFVCDYCRLNRLEAEVIIDDGVSAGRPLCERRGGRILLALIDGGIRHVVAYKLDRLFRDSIEANTQIDDWEKKGVVTHLLDIGGNTVNTGSAIGRFMFQVLAACAELERNRIRERTADALRFKKSRMEVYGPVPIGFDCCDGKLERNHEEQEVVERIYEMHNGGMSLRGIARTLNENDVPTKHGKMWHASTIRLILKNDIHQAI